MPTPPRWIALVALLLLSLCQTVASGQATQPSPQPSPRTWELAGREWRESNAPATQRTPDAVLDRVERMIDRRQYKPAMKLAVQWLLANPNSPNRDRGLLLE